MLKTMSPVVFLAMVTYPGAFRRTQEDTDVHGAREQMADAYVYGLPIMEMYKLMTEAKLPTPNLLTSEVEALSCEFDDVVSPNVDTAYTSAFLDLSAEPMVLSVSGPVKKPRYYSFAMFDMYTNAVYSSPDLSSGYDNRSWSMLGLRNLGRTAWSTLIFADGTSLGSNTGGFDAYAKSQTSMTWLLGRTGLLENSGEGVAQVTAIQDTFSLAPLSVFRLCKCSSGAADCQACLRSTHKPKPAPTSFYKADTALDWYSTLNKLLNLYPPPAADKQKLQALARFGVGPGLDLTESAMKIAKDGQKRGKADIYAQLVKRSGSIATNDEGLLNPPIGDARFGTSYLDRAVVAEFGFGGNDEAEAIYPSYRKDSRGQVLKGSEDYKLKFATAPPVLPGGFWSITLYRMSTNLLVCNAINRLNIGTFSESNNCMQKDSDGGFTLLLGPSPPDDDAKSCNWLPTPQSGTYYMILRQYLPKMDSEGSPVFKPQAVVRV